MNRITALAATVALTAGSLALTAPAAQAAPAKYKVTAKANTEIVIVKEDTVKIRGRVTPKAAGQKVVLQQRVGNKKSWKVTASAKVKGNGTYVLKDKPTTPGSRVDARRTAAGAGRETLHHQVLAHEGLGHDQVVDVEVVVVLGVGDGRVQRLADVLGDALVAEFQLVQRALDLEAADRLSDEVQLAGAGAQGAHLGHRFDGLQPTFFGLLAHRYFLFAFLSAA